MAYTEEDELELKKYRKQLKNNKDYKELYAIVCGYQEQEKELTRYDLVRIVVEELEREVDINYLEIINYLYEEEQIIE